MQRGGGKYRPPTASLPLNLGFLGCSHLLANIGLGLLIPNKRLNGEIDNLSYKEESKKYVEDDMLFIS